MPMTKSIRFNLKPGDSGIETVRQKSRDFFKSHGVSDDTVDAQMTILKELVSSGNKFGSLRAMDSNMTVLLLIEKNLATVEVRKPVGESCLSKLDELDKTIQLIRGYQDPFEPYIIKRRDASDKLTSDNTEGFDLARIAFETGAVIDFYVNEDNILNLSAVRSLA